MSDHAREGEAVESKLEPSEVWCGCGGRHLHISGATIYKANDDYQATPVRVELEPFTISEGVVIGRQHRGHEVEIRFWCERCYFLSSVTYSFHKGTVYRAATGITVDNP